MHYYVDWARREIRMQAPDGGDLPFCEMDRFVDQPPPPLLRAVTSPYLTDEERAELQSAIQKIRCGDEAGTFVPPEVEIEVVPSCGRYFCACCGAAVFLNSPTGEVRSLAPCIQDSVGRSWCEKCGRIALGGMTEVGVALMGQGMRQAPAQGIPVIERDHRWKPLQMNHPRSLLGESPVPTYSVEVEGCDEFRQWDKASHDFFGVSVAPGAVNGEVLDVVRAMDARMAAAATDAPEPPPKATGYYHGRCHECRNYTRCGEYSDGRFCETCRPGEA